MAAPTTITSSQISATPILDCYSPLPKRRHWKRALGWTVWFATILVLPWAPQLTRHSTLLAVAFRFLDLTIKTFFGTMLPPDKTLTLFNLLLPWFAIYCALIIHEFGHVLAGLAVRFRANFLIIYPFRFTRTQTGWAVRRERLISISGAASMLPREFEHLRLRTIVYVLGGPAANFLTFLILRTALPNVGQAPNHTVFLLDSLANISLFLGAINLLPFHARGFESDGARVLMAVANERKFLRWFALFRLATATAAGTRTRDLDPAILQTALQLDDNSSDSMRANLLAYSWASDREDIVSAAGYLEKSLAYGGSLPKKTRCLLMLEAAVFHGWYREDALRAAHWLNLAGSSRKGLPMLYRLRPEIAVAWAEGRVPEAQSKLQQAVVAVRQMPANASRNSLESSMTEWQQKMQLRLQARQASATKN